VSVDASQNLPVLLWGTLGSLALLLLQRLIAQFFPHPPASVYSSARRAAQPPSEEEGDGMGAVYAMDDALIDAELERPGSTFWIYYRQPMALFARLLGSVLIAFPAAAWILGASTLSCGTILAVLVGIAFTLYPWQTWWMSRPRLKKD
jgi:hypothetical protein